MAFSLLLFTAFFSYYLYRISKLSNWSNLEYKSFFSLASWCYAPLIFDDFGAIAMVILDGNTQSLINSNRILSLNNIAYQFFGTSLPESTVNFTLCKFWSLALITLFYSYYCKINAITSFFVCSAVIVPTVFASTF